MTTFWILGYAFYLYLIATYDFLLVRLGFARLAGADFTDVALVDGNREIMMPVHTA